MQKIPFVFGGQCLFTFLYSIIRKVITFFFGAKTVTFSGSCQGAGKYIKKTAYSFCPNVLSTVQYMQMQSLPAMYKPPNKWQHKL